MKFIRLVILIVYFALFYIIIKMILKDFNLSYFIILFMYSSLILFSIGFILEAIKVGKLYWNQSIIKNILRLFGIIATTLALVVSRHSINLITKIDSSHFPIAISIFTFLLTPFAWMFLVIMFLFLFYTIISILMPFRLTVMQFKFVIEFILLIRNHRIFCFLFWMNKMNCASSRTNFLLIWPARAAGAITIGYYSVQLIVLIASNSFLYQQQIYTFISKGIVYSSYHSISSECKNHIRGEWIALIGDNKASIAKINNLGSFDFEIRSCE
ncbi:MAG: hypothetical protein HC851_11010 [Acaryochloris sp. RU_4_1]|nr:hypothetical protein [Acaryochloris sp. RU_4_1]NJR54811.1 hypothetical protein [Acaryochloris sp. CRU_2_0]